MVTVMSTTKWAYPESNALTYIITRHTMEGGILPRKATNLAYLEIVPHSSIFAYYIVYFLAFYLMFLMLVNKKSSRLIITYATIASIGYLVHLTWDSPTCLQSILHIQKFRRQ